MSEAANKPQPSAKPAPQTQTAPPKRRSWGWLGWLFSLLIIAPALAAGGYWLWMHILAREAAFTGQLQQQHTQLEQLQTRLQQQQTQLQTILDGESARQAHLEQQLAAAREAAAQQLNTMTGQIENLRKSQQPDNHHLRLAAVEWLILSAYTHNTLQLDPALAINALGIVDQQLSPLPPLQVAGLRRALANVQAELATAAELDITGISAQLEALDKRVNSLDLLVQRVPAPAAAAEPDEIPFWEKMWRDFRALIVVEQRTEEADLLLLPELSQVLRQRIGLSLDFAQGALLRRDQTRYRAHLESLETLVSEHFASAPETDAWLKQVRELAARQIALPVVSFDKLLSSLRELRATLNR